MLYYLRKFLAVLNTAEGFIHIIVATIGIWGLVETQSWDWRLWVAPLENLVFGLFSLLTGYVLGMHHRHHS